MESIIINIRFLIRMNLGIKEVGKYWVEKRLNEY